MKILKKFIYIIGLLTIVGAIGVYIFMNHLSDDDKVSILRDAGIENSGFARDLAKESYLKCEVLSSRKNIFGDKWIINGAFYSNNKSMNFTEERTSLNSQMEKKYTNLIHE